MMEVVDQCLRDAGVSVHARQLRAWLDISYSLGMNLCFPSGPVPVRAGVFEGIDLSQRILSWYEDRYGAEKLATPPSMCRCLVRLRGELWAFEPPLVIGSCVFVVDPKPGPAPNVGFGRDRPPRFNVPDGIRGLPDSLRKLLAREELVMLLDVAKEGFWIANGLQRALDVGMMREVFSDLEQSVEHILGRVIHYGQGRWSALQAAEKALKTAIAVGGEKYPRTHDLAALGKVAERCGVRASESLIKTVQCSADTRYTEEGSSRDHAYASHWSALRIVRSVTNALSERA